MLVVEDNEVVGELVSLLFKTLGFEVDVIANGSRVIPYLEAKTPDVMILDLDLPGMTGDKVFGAIRADQRLKDLIVIPFTAYRDDRTPGTLPSNLIWAEYTKSGKIPNIVFKTDDENAKRDVNQRLVDEVAYRLNESGKPITKEMAAYYLKTRGVAPGDIFKSLAVD